MTVLEVLHIVAAAATILTGLLALLKPKSAYGFTGLTDTGGRGVTEMRAIFGGLFIALGLFPIVVNDPVAFHMLGWGYLAIAAVRLPAMFIDHSVVKSNIISLVIEIVLGVILVL
jgi:hypothetical protein